MSLPRCIKRIKQFIQFSDHAYNRHFEKFKESFVMVHFLQNLVYFPNEINGANATE